MNSARRLSKIKSIQSKIDECEKALFDAIRSGLSSATVSSGGASQSYTRYSLDDLRKYITYLREQLTILMFGTSRRRTSPDFDIGFHM